MPSPTPPLTYTTLVSLYTTHLTIAIHTILASRALYPSTSFLRARAYNLPVMQSRHPGVCQWITDAVKAAEIELLKGTVARVALVIWGAWWEGGGSAESGENERSKYEAGNGEDAVLPLERYVWDVSRWPVIPQAELHTPLTRASFDQTAHHNTNANQDTTTKAIPTARHPTDEEKRTASQATLKAAHSDLHEQFRTLLSRLTSISANLAPLPGGADRCTYTLAVELKEESEPPIGHPQVWVPCERGMQRSVVFEGDDDADGGDGSREEGEGGADESARGKEKAKGRVGREKEGGRMIERGKELGGVRTTPVRTIDQGEMVFEMWIEEGRAKFHNRYTRKEGSNQTSQSSA